VKSTPDSIGIPGLAPVITGWAWRVDRDVLLIMRGPLRTTRLAPIVVVLLCWTTAARAQSMDGPPMPARNAGVGSGVTVAEAPAARRDKPPLPFWTSRRIVLLAGLGAALTAGVIGWSRDRELARQRRAIQAIPPGSHEEFQRQLEDAHLLAKARDFWFTAAFGIGGAAVCYVVTTSPDIRPLPGNHTWIVSINPIALAITVTRAF
jgi:hypothetical protein